MLKRVLQLFFAIIGAALGFSLFPDLINLISPDLNSSIVPYAGGIIGVVLLFLLSLWLSDPIVRMFGNIEERLVKAPIGAIIFGTLGIIAGLIIAYLIQPLLAFSPVANWIISCLMTFLLAYFGFLVGFKKREELFNFFSMSQRKEKKKESVDHAGDEMKSSASQAKLKILDTSVIIDGRIADICQSGFIEGTLVIPQYVLLELQHIADSSDVLKRNRGRRGLDILNRIRKKLDVDVDIYEGDFEDIKEVDSKLVELAKLTGGVVVTNDFNLNKVCELQNVEVLNINDLANAVKPVVLPGETMNVQIIKDGKERNQGVGYLDDGTMIVVEEGKNYMSQTIEAIVTSVLQTSAGRMIFAKPKALEKAL